MLGDRRSCFRWENDYLAAVHAPYRAQYQVREVPDCFPELNTGVILFQQSKQTDLLFKRWAEIYREDQSKPLDWIFPGGALLYRRAIPNQPSFRRAIYESSLRIATLPPEYNCRIPFPGAVHSRVKIIHGRADDFPTIGIELNRTVLPRIHVMRWGKLKTLDNAMPAGENILARTRWSLHHRGILNTAKATIINLIMKVREAFIRSGTSGIR